MSFYNTTQLSSTSLENAEEFIDVNQQHQSNMSNHNATEEEIIINYQTCIESNYTTLLSMFPNVGADYIRQICVKPPFETNDNNNCLVMLINHLLGYENKTDESLISELPKISNVDQQNDKILAKMVELQELEILEEQKQNEQLFSEFMQQEDDNIDNKMEILENILPDADPYHLKNFLHQNHKNINLLQDFVESKLVDKNYQKRDKCYEKLKIQKIIEQYTTNFDVIKFINEFPEPFEYFESPDKKGIRNNQALNFLIHRYGNHFDKNYIENIYSSNKYNLSLADKHLQTIYGHNSTDKFTIEFDNISLLQEMTFINNKAIIKDYLEVIKKREEKEMRLLKAQKLLLECQCCFNEVKPTECIECENNHIFCKSCIIKGTELAISNGQSSVNCFKEDECNSEFSLNILKRVLSPMTFDIFFKCRQVFEIRAAKLDGLVDCPFCQYSMELGPEIKIFMCKNPECKKITCRLCKRMNHLPVKCEDVLDEHKGRLYVEEQMSDELIRYCPKCNMPFIKLFGCNKMTCKCGASMCYICKQLIRNYDHFTRNFTCQKDSATYVMEQVEIRRIEAITKLHQDFPDLQLSDV